MLFHEERHFVFWIRTINFTLSNQKNLKLLRNQPSG